MNRFAGIAFALGGTILWGLFPLYWKQLIHINDLEVLAHRMLWSVPFLGLVLVLTKQGRYVIDAFRPLGRIGYLAMSSVMISFNWGAYIYAVGVDKVVEASMGYFLSPLMTVALGMAVFREQLTRTQTLAVSIAGVSVLFLFLTRDVAPWLAIALGASFAGYNALRKRAPQDSVVGLFVETLLLAPLALIFIAVLLAEGNAGFVQHGNTTLVLVLLAGVVTATPLVLFVAGGRRMALSKLALFFYLTPTIQFFVGVYIYNEPLPASDLIAFAGIWIALVIFAGGGYISARRNHTRDAS